MRPIVVIDDDADIREVLIFALENEGYEVLSYENGKRGFEALSKLNEDNMPFFIIVDYLMPEMNGAEFIEKVRTEFPDTLGKVPIAISSAMGNFDPAIKETKNLIHIHKPMELDDLLKQVKQHYPQ